MGFLKSVLNRSMSGFIVIIDEIKIIRKRIDEMFFEFIKLKKEVKLLLLFFIFYLRKIFINVIYCLGCFVI